MAIAGIQKTKSSFTVKTSLKSSIEFFTVEWLADRTEIPRLVIDSSLHRNDLAWIAVIAATKAPQSFTADSP
jgi:hypothetical protein